MTSFIKHTLAALALSSFIIPGAASAQNQETVKATHGDWEIRCAQEDEKLCVMSQIGKTAEGKTALEVRIRKLEGQKSQDGQVIPAAIQITTPLGSILRAGVRVQVDDAEPRTGVFEVCVPAGCIVRDAMSEAFLDALKAGKRATMSFNMLQQGEIKVDISLKGFTKAFGSM